MPKATSRHQILDYTIYGLVGLTMLAACVLSSPVVDAVPWATDTASITLESSCSMTATLNSEHTAMVLNGTYSSGDYPNGIGKTTIQTFCNDKDGYAIYAVGYTGNELGNNKLENASLSSDFDIVTGTATGATSGGDISNWAMKISAVTGTDYTPSVVNGFDVFSSVPSTYTKVARFNGITDSSQGTNIGSKIETTYAAYISGTQPSGTYTGQVKYVLVHPSLAAPDIYVMQDIANWKSSLIPEQQVTVIDNRDNKVYTVALMDDGNVWMTQNLDLCIGCSGTAVLTSENTDLTAYDTNGDGTGTVFNGYSRDSSTGVITWTPTGTTMTGVPATVTYTTSGNGSVSGWTNSKTAPYMAEGEDAISYNGTRYFTTVENNVKTTALSKCEAGGHTEAECLHYRVGNYYNWTAAVAMNDTTSYTANGDVMPNSICPAGWRLPDGPMGGNISEFNTLLNIYGVSNGNDDGSGASAVNVGYRADGLAKIGSAPLYLTRSGDPNGTTLYYYGVGGEYHTSMAYDADGTYYLYFNASALYPARRNYRSIGESVRCVYTPTYTMQEVTSSDLAEMLPNDGDTKVLYDSRDGTGYLVGKLADDNYWMLNNLALDPTNLKSGVVLSSANTNMPENDTAGFSAAFTSSMIKNSGFSSYTAPMINVASKDEKQILAVLGHDSSSAPASEFTEPIGVYYNYCAATAGTYCKADDHADTGNAEYDICPKGWRLPTGGDYDATTGQGEFQYLGDRYGGDNADFAAAFRMPLSGYFHASSAGNQGSYGYFWTSTYYSSTEMHRLSVSSTNANLTDYRNRSNGFSVRCVFDGN